MTPCEALWITSAVVFGIGFGAFLAGLFARAGFFVGFLGLALAVLGVWAGSTIGFTCP
jgi:disulfide bond formation protein DsbB